MKKIQVKNCWPILDPEENPAPDDWAVFHHEVYWTNRINERNARYPVRIQYARVPRIRTRISLVRTGFSDQIRVSTLMGYETIPFVTLMKMSSRSVAWVAKERTLISFLTSARSTSHS